MRCWWYVSLPFVFSLFYFVVFRFICTYIFSSVWNANQRLFSLGIPSLTVNDNPSRSSTNRPSTHRTTTRHRQGSKESSFALSFPPTTASPTAAFPPPWTHHPRAFRALGHINAHSSRLLCGAVPPESVLFHVCKPRQARRRHGAALDEGAFVCHRLRTRRSSFPLFTTVLNFPPGWKDAMYHGISRLVTLSPQGFGK